jgi:hypothetical protein
MKYLLLFTGITNQKVRTIRRTHPPLFESFNLFYSFQYFWINISITHFQFPFVYTDKPSGLLDELYLKCRNPYENHYFPPHK